MDSILNEISGIDTVTSISINMSDFPDAKVCDSDINFDLSNIRDKLKLPPKRQIIDFSYITVSEPDNSSNCANNDEISLPLASDEDKL